MCHRQDMYNKQKYYCSIVPIHFIIVQKNMYGDLKLCTARQTHNLIRLVFRFRQTNLLHVRSCFDRAFILCYITAAATTTNKY